MPLPVIAAVALAAAPVIMGMYASHKANEAAEDQAREKRDLQRELEALESSRQQIRNPYDNLAVATQAAEIKMEEVDYNLSATLDTIQAMGAGASTATALAREANKAKLQIAADLEKQEVDNQKLKAQGDQFVFTTQENREMQKLDRTAGLLDRATLQEMQYRSDAISALSGGVSGGANVAGAVAPYVG